MKSMLNQSFKVIVEYLGKEKEFIAEIRKAENKGFETYAEAKAHAEAVVNKYNKAVAVEFAVVVNSYDWLGNYAGTHFCEKVEAGNEPAEAPAEEKVEKKSIFLTKSVANDVPMVYNNKCSKETNQKQTNRKKEFKMTKTVFTFTVKGQKQTFNTMKELVEAKRELIANGTNVDLYSIKKEEVKVKASASIEFDSYTSEDAEKRTLTAYVTVKSEQAEEVFMALASIMEAELGESFMWCPLEEDGVYTDGITVDYEHGSMTSIKEDIKHVFKMAKKQLGIR